MKILTSEYTKKWTEFEYAVLDLEGTGSQHKENEGIVDIAGVLVKDGVVAHEHFSHLLNPEISIPSFISRIHGITNKDVQNKPKLAEVKSGILTFCEGRILVSHNAPVERRVLRFRLPEYEPPIIFDTLKMSRTAYQEEKKHSLDEMIKRLNLESVLSSATDSKRHSAFYDALATAHAFVVLANRLVGKEGVLQDLLKYNIRD